MGEIDKRKRTEEGKEGLANQVLALKEAGWTHREITKELGISSKSIKPLYDLGVSLIPIPDKETVQRENILQINAKLDEINRRLADPDLPITATNVPNLIHQWAKLRKDLNTALEVGVKNKVEFGFEGTFYEMLMNRQNEIFGPDGTVIMEDEEIEEAEVVEDDANEDSEKNDA